MPNLVKRLRGALMKHHRLKFGRDKGVVVTGIVLIYSSPCALGGPS